MFLAPESCLPSTIFVYKLGQTDYWCPLVAKLDTIAFRLQWRSGIYNGWCIFLEINIME